MITYRKPPRLSESIAEEIKSDIIKGFYNPGERLKIIELAKRFSVSQTTIREALKILERSDLVCETPHRGYIVTSVTLKELIDIWTIKEALWGLAFEWFTKRASKDLIIEARTHVDLFKKAYIKEDIDAAFEANFSFTDVILKGCGSKKLENLLRSIEDQVKQYRYRSMGFGDNLRVSSQYFSDIMNAIEQRNSALASKLIGEYIRFSKKILVKYFQSLKLSGKNPRIEK